MPRLLRLISTHKHAAARTHRRDRRNAHV